MDKKKGNSKPKKYEIVPTALLLGIVVFLTGTGLAYLSSGYSYTGFEATWPEVPSVGYIGICVAILAYVAFFAPPILQKTIGGWKGLIAAALCIIAGGFLAYGDGYGNEQALRADIRGDTESFQKLSGEYTIAQNALPGFLDDAAAIRDAQKILLRAFEYVPTDTAEQTTEKIKKAQTILQNAGKYEGRIDGKPLKLTEDAARAHGPELQKRLDELQVKIDAANVVLSRGEPMQVDVKKSEAATWIGYGVTLAGIFCSLLSSLLFQTGIRKAPVPDEVEPDYLSDEHLERLTKNTERNLKLISGKVASDVLAKSRNARRA